MGHAVGYAPGPGAARGPRGDVRQRLHGQPRVLPEPHQHPHRRLFPHHRCLYERDQPAVRGVQGVRRSSDHRDGAAGVGLSDRPVGQEVPQRVRRRVRPTPAGIGGSRPTTAAASTTTRRPTTAASIDTGPVRRPTRTDLLADRAVAFIDRTPASQPLFLYFAPHAPHHPATPAPGDHDSFADLPTWRPPSYDEPDVSDKPEYLRERTLSGLGRARVDAFRLDQYRSLLAVDRAVGRIADALAASSRLENTMIVFASDNGMLWGEHRWASKNVPYEESIRVPLVVRYDAMTAGAARTDEHLVLNIDLAPTFAGLAGTWLPNVDGLSLVPLLRSRSFGWRTDFLIEHLNLGSVGPPTFCAVRDERHKLVRYGNGERELYDLHADPLELRNRYDVPKYRPVERSSTIA